MSFATEHCELSSREGYRRVCVLSRGEFYFHGWSVHPDGQRVAVLESENGRIYEEENLGWMEFVDALQP